MTGRRLNIVVNTCEECPYCVYDSDYGMSYDSGWDCNHPDSKLWRLINEGEMKAWHRKYQEYLRSLHTLFPLDPPTDPPPFTIPDECPLEVENEENTDVLEVRERSSVVEP